MHPPQNVTPRLTRTIHSLQGLSCGDAFGQHLFVHPDVAHSLITQRVVPSCPWRYTDDTAMTISILEILEEFGEIHPERLAENFGRRFIAEPRRGYGPSADQATTTCATVGGIVAMSAGLESIPSSWIKAREPLPACFLE